LTGDIEVTLVIEILTSCFARPVWALSGHRSRKWWLVKAGHHCL